MRTVPQPRTLSGLRLLCLNWRCPSHPWAGGAEEYCWQIATHLASAGNAVTLFAAESEGQPRHELRDKVTILRHGHRFTVYIRAGLFLLRRQRDFDAIIDYQNGIPFFSPLFLLYHRIPVVCVVHHVHQDQFAQHLGGFMASIGRWLESTGSRLVYRNHPIVAVSPSTRQAILERLRLRGPIVVIPNGVVPPEAVPPLRQRSTLPRVLFLGRLVPHKRVHLLLHAVATLREKWPEIEVDIAGTGPEFGSLIDTTKRLNLGSVVHFWGRVSNMQRDRLLAQDWLLIMPSQNEGFGVTILEANRVGRPALGMRVPGLIDSIVPDINGWLVDGPGQLAQGIDGALEKLARQDTMLVIEAACIEWSRHFSWERSAATLGRLVMGELDHRTGTFCRDIITAPELDTEWNQAMATSDVGGTDRLDPSAKPTRC